MRTATLAAKFTALTLGLVFIAGAGGFLGHVASERAAGEALLRQHGLSLARLLAEASRDGIRARDEAMLRPLVASPFAHPSVAYVAVRTPDLRPLCARTRGGSRRPPPLGAGGSRPQVGEAFVTRVEVDGDPCLDVVVPVRGDAPGTPELDGSPAGSGSSAPGYVQLGVSLEPLEARFREGLKEGLAFTALMMVVGAVLTLLLTRRVTGAIRELRGAADGVTGGAGDLTRVLAVRPGDEVGALAASFNGVVSRLREMVKRVRDSAAQLNGAIAAVGENAWETREGARNQIQAVDESSRAVEDIGRGVDGVAASTTDLLTSSLRSASAVAQMESAGQHIAARVESLSTVVAEVSSAIRALSTGSQQVMANAEILAGSAASTAAGIGGVTETVRGIEEGAATTQRLCETVTRDAEQGKTAVEATVDGIRAIQEAAEETGRVVEDLGVSCTEIGGILEVISDVAEQSSLLGLNAAILAAQAGDSGRGFTVVASEMGDLAERAATATARIEEIVATLQGRAERAIQGMRASRERVHAEVARSETAAGALGKIQGSAGQALEQVRKITRATREHAQSSETIVAAVQQVAAAVETIAVTIQQQTVGLQQLDRAAETMAEIAREVRVRTDEQARATAEVRQMAEDVRSSAEEIDAASRGQKERCQDASQAISRLRELSQEGNGRAGALDEALHTLAQQIRLLEREVRAFRT